MNPADILLAIPTRGSIHSQLVSRLQDLRTRYPELSVASSAGHLSSHETRNQLAQAFLKGPWSALVMVDDDIVPPADFLSLVNHLDSYDVVGAACPVYQPLVSPIPMIAAYDYESSIDAWSHVGDFTTDGLIRCDGVGFGCVAIRRSAFNDRHFPYFVQRYNSQGSESDDLSFCRGLHVACDFDVHCEHHSTVPLLQLMAGVSSLLVYETTP